MTGTCRNFEPQDITDLPSVIPIFPLAGALLLPRATLPLNIFEPQYLAMVEETLGRNRFIGMIQPSGSAEAGTAPALYRAGCLGRISAFQETRDGRILISLRGVCRYNVAEELTVNTPYRQAAVDYTGFADDLTPPNDTEIRREVLLPLLRAYLERHKMSVDWQCVEAAAPETLVNSLSMICPFGSCEKQVLLEARTLSERSRRLARFLELADAADLCDRQVQ